MAVDIAHHANTVPGGNPLRCADTPIAHGTCVVTIGAIDAQRRGHVHHQPVCVFSLFNGAAVFTRERLCSLNADIQVIID